MIKDEKKSKLNDIAALIVENNYFIIMGHIDPDGDCLGSSFALKWLLDKLDKNALVLLEEELDNRYDFLQISKDDYGLLSRFSSVFNENKVIVFALDAGDLARLGDRQRIARERFIVNIDHHEDNPEYGDLNYVNPNMAATGEIIYQLSKQLQSPLDLKIARALATAIIADTGSFKYQNTRSEVFKVMSSLMDYGIDIYEINRAIFASYSYQSLKLRGKALSSLNLSKNKKVAWLKLDLASIENLGAEISDSSGLVNYARDVKGVEVGISFVEIARDKIKVGFRSNNYCPVNEVAALFGGGGHPRAAGCLIEKGIDQTITMVLDKVTKYV